jgi:MFS family permease
LRLPGFADLKGVVEDTLKASIMAQFLCSLAFGLMGSFMPLFINRDLGESLVNATYWTGVSNLAWYGGLAFTAPVWGWVCDKVGTKKVLIFVLIGNIATYAGMAFSQNVTQLVLLRII